VNPKLYDTDQAAAMFGLTREGLERWRQTGRGPKWIKLGNGKSAPIRYRSEDIEAWLAERTFTSTSDATVKSGKAA
jgi:predicted DNA-binding transcriptional regulator AlpA